jgi:hypothetical protein
MGNAVKLGPLWNRVTFDAAAGVVKHRGRTVARFDEIAALKVVEYIATYEQEQLLNLHPEVQKSPRNAELWLELKSGKQVMTTSMEQAGLLLAAVAPLTGSWKVPIKTERRLIDQAK